MPSSEADPVAPVSYKSTHVCAQPHLGGVTGPELQARPFLARNTLPRGAGLAGLGASHDERAVTNRAGVEPSSSDGGVRWMVGAGVFR